MALGHGGGAPARGREGGRAEEDQHRVGRPWATWIGESGGRETVSMHAGERRREWWSTAWNRTGRGAL